MSAADEVKAITSRLAMIPPPPPPPLPIAPLPPRDPAWLQIVKEWSGAITFLAALLALVIVFALLKGAL